MKQKENKTDKKMDDEDEIMESPETPSTQPNV